MNLPLAYKPKEYDDWGLIRDALGEPLLDVRGRVYWDADALNEHRRIGTDPAEAIGREVVAKLNTYDEIVAQRDALLSACELGLAELRGENYDGSPADTQETMAVAIGLVKGRKVAAEDIRQIDEELNALLPDDGVDY